MLNLTSEELDLCIESLEAAVNVCMTTSAAGRAEEMYKVYKILVKERNEAIKREKEVVNK